MALLGLIIVEVVVQLLYPSQYTLPFARYNHEPYGLKHQSELATLEQQRFLATKVELHSENDVQVTTLSKMGATLDETASNTSLTHYPLLWRFVPFSIMFERPDVTALPVQFATTPLEEFSESFARNYTTPATNAQIKLREDKIVATDATPGRNIDASALRRTIKATRYDASGIVRVSVPEQTIDPQATAADLAPVRQQAEAAIAKEIIISVAGRDETFTPTRGQIASWLRLTEKAGEVTLELDQKAVRAYSDTIDNEVAIAPRETVLTIVDGREQSRKEGAAGEQVNRDDFEQKISSILFVPGQYKFIQAELEPMAPHVRRIYQYTNTQAGLQAKVNEIGQRYDVRISLRQLDGAGWQAAYRADESTPSASTYKLYVALRLFHELNQGRTDWGAPMLGTTVAECFDQMILVSTNQCAEEWIRQYGRGNINDFLAQRGISPVTTFTSADATRTSANDLVRVVTGIYDGSLVTGSNRDKLLEMMSRQIWRKGIPSGTKGWTSDKVGFLWDYVHDVGIVHHPRGTYAMAVMTKGASYGIIAQITRELEALMYP